MAVTGKLYGNFLKQALAKEHDLIADDIKVQLHTNLYSPDQDAHAYKNPGLSAEVAAGGGYATGGVSLAGKTLTYTGATNKIAFSANNVTWAASTITARTAVVYNNTPALDTAKGLVCYQQSDVDIISTNGNWTITWNASGIMEITVS